MSKQLGETFGQELIAAGLGGIPISWGDTDDSIQGRERLTPEQNAKLDEVIARHDPTKQPLTTRIISDRQFFQALAQLRVITKEEALAAVRTGTIPHAFDDLMQGMDEQAHFVTQMLLSGATQFERDHSLVPKFGEALGWTNDQIDDLWRMAAAL
jgi:hypothetical protein